MCVLGFVKNAQLLTLQVSGKIPTEVGSRALVGIEIDIRYSQGGTPLSLLSAVFGQSTILSIGCKLVMGGFRRQVFRLTPRSRRQFKARSR